MYMLECSFLVNKINVKQKEKKKRFYIHKVSIINKVLYNNHNNINCWTNGFIQEIKMSLKINNNKINKNQPNNNIEHSY